MLSIGTYLKLWTLFAMNDFILSWLKLVFWLIILNCSTFIWVIALSILLCKIRSLQQSIVEVRCCSTGFSYWPYRIFTICLTYQLCNWTMITSQDLPTLFDKVTVNNVSSSNDRVIILTHVFHLTYISTLSWSGDVCTV